MWLGEMSKEYMVTWSGILYFLSFLSVGLAIYTTRIVKKAAGNSYSFLYVALGSALFILSSAWIEEKRSVLMVAIGANTTHAVMAGLFPLMTYFQISIFKQKVRFAQYLLKVQFFISAITVIMISVQRYCQVELIDGNISLILNKTFAFYLLLVYGISSLLGNILLIKIGFMGSGYKRDFMLGIFWIACFGISIAGFVIWFYFPGFSKYECFVVFFLLLQGFNYNRHYYAAISSFSNLPDYLYSTIKTPFLILTEDGTVLLANNSAVSFFQKPQKELIGTDMMDLFDFEGQVLFFSKNVKTGNQIDRIKATVFNNNAKCEIEITYVYDAYGELFYVIFIVYDITNQVNLINELERTKYKAELANKAKSAFLANTSHEIRTPMNAIIGMSELILREKISPEVFEYTMGIKQAGDNLLSIINDILDFSKIESGKLELVPSHYYLRSIINDIINIIRMRITEKSLSFITDIDAALPNDLWGDDVRVRQILLNILGNAVKYTEKGFIRLSVTAEDENVEEKSFILKIVVEDSGIGIREEDLDKVFGEFIQVDVSVNKGIEGTGLGLAITKRLCMLMGGDVWVNSVYGKGSIFTVRVPQKINSNERFASVVEPEKKPVLVYENRSMYAASLHWSLDNLKVPHVLVSSAEEFNRALHGDNVPPDKKTGYAFIAYALYIPLRNSLEPFIETLENKPCIVLMADYGADAGGRAVRLLPMPIHTLSIANILNNKADLRNDVKKGKTIAKFTAPAARVLLVDDIITNLKVAEGLMLPYHMIIDSCKSGRESIELLKKNIYDMVFMDHMMPDMDGIAATKIIRNLDDPEGYFKKVPIIVLTANAISGMREMFLGQGFNDYLAKPIEMLKLHEILERWLPEGKRIKTTGGSGVGPDFEEDNSVITGIFEGKHLEGIDIQEGLERYKNDISYLKILHFYANSTPELLNVLRAVSPENLGAYAVTVHGIKGSSYQISANEVGKQAEVLEMAAKAGDWEMVKKNNEPFIRAMEALFANMRKFLADTEVKADKSSVSEPDRGLLAKMLAACKEYNITVMEAALIELEKYSYKSGEDLVVWLRQQLDGLDYEAIRERLENLQ
jgi:signal transduction histidine kinase/CheY-like chemotaxis protein